MSAYTPTTEVIIHRLEYPNERLGEPRPITRAQFDRWLAEHDRQVKAQAWDEAVDTLSNHWEDLYPAPVNDLERRNPYKEEA